MGAGLKYAIGRLRLDRIRALDPASDSGDGPVSRVALLFFLVGLCVNLSFFLACRAQPMMDFFMHAAHVRYVSEWGRGDSPYAGMFEAPDLLAANTLFYSLGGALAKVFNPLSVARFLIGSMYVLGYPLVTLYSLRVFGRSVWGAVLANALVFERFFTSGFASELIGFPLSLLAITLFYRMLRNTTLGRAALLSVLLALVFLAHAFIFFWTGVVLAVMSFVAAPFALRAGLRSFARTAGGVALAVTPALFLCARWVLHSSHRYGVAPQEGGHDMIYLPAPEAFRRIAEYVEVGRAPWEQMLLACLLLLVGVAVALGRLERRRQPPVLELLCAATFFSYFLLPEQVRSETVVNMRQLNHAMWLAPALVSPVSARASRLARYVVISGILIYSYAHTSLWREILIGYEREAQGLVDVMAKAPPRKRLDFPNLGMDSGVIYSKVLWHAEAYYVACCGGVIWDVPGADDPQWWLRFRKGARPIPMGRALGQDWSLVPWVWDEYDLVLVHGWRPSPAALQAAQRSASLIAESGDWQLWGKNR
jgi:hypothetical protein